jgi:hypothetical protein
MIIFTQAEVEFRGDVIGVRDSKLIDLLVLGAPLVVLKLEVAADKAKNRDLSARVVLEDVDFSDDILIEQVIEIIAKLSRE